MDLLEILNHIQPADLDYSEWLQVGMALKHEGYSCADWDRWSVDDPRYKSGVCESKWETFQEQALSVVTAGTIVHMAADHGWTPPTKTEGGHAVSWDEYVGAKFVPDLDQLEIEEVPRLFARWDPVNEVRTFLKAAFQEDDIVGIVINADWSEHEGRWLLERGVSSRTAGQILDDLDRYKSVSLAIGDCGKECGAWIRVNPLDGNGVGDRNVTDYRHVLVESDSLDIKTQYTLIKELNLPVSALTYSGGKSLHALVKVNAKSYRQYKERVEHIYRVCDENGLKVDKADRNPSRLSRFPGFRRGSEDQYLIATHIGCGSYEEWCEYVESLDDDLPEIESLETMMKNGFPPLKPEFWQGIARVGSKVLVVGPSKSGKSMFLIRMGICIAEGLPLMGRQMLQGHVCLINFEIPDAEYWERIMQVYEAMGVTPTEQGQANLHVWNMRGKSDRLDKLAAVLIRRLKRQQTGYTAVVVDPIYKTITGDENSASEMAAFCNYLDKICTDLQTTLIYAHHFSKGAQGGKKAIDRASGSGVFGRDPDAIITLTELLQTDQDRTFRANSLAATEYRKALMKYAGWTSDDFDEDLKWDPEALHEELIEHGHMHDEELDDLDAFISAEQKKILKQNALRMEMTLRSFPEPDPVNLFYQYPLHAEDTKGVLKDAILDGVYQPDEVLKYGRKKGSQAIRERTDGSVEKLEKLIAEHGPISIKEAAAKLETSDRTARRWANKSKKLTIDSGVIKEQ